MSAKILLADDHAMFRKGLRGLLEKKGFRVVGEAGDGREALEKARELSPDVVVMDITMPNLDGIEATRGLTAESPGIKVIVLSIHGGKRFVEKVLQAGAAGYVLKDSAPEELMDAVRTVLRGERYLSTSITGLVVSQYVELLSRVHATGGSANLTNEEREFIQLVGEGCTGEEIAERLAANEEATASLQQRVLEKLDLSSVSELTEYAGAQKWFAGQEEIESALHQVAVSSNKKTHPPRPRTLIEPLTNRELDVLELLAQRLYDKEIADQLSVAVTTVKTHVGNILQKLGVGNRREAVAKGRSLGLLVGR